MWRAGFFMVVGKGAPVVRHGDYDEALKEAKRLARSNPGQEFIVLASVSRVVRPDVVVVPMPADQIPF